VQRALAKSPADRFATMEELIAALPSRAGVTPAPGWAAPPSLPAALAVTPLSFGLGPPPTPSDPRAPASSRARWTLAAVCAAAGAGVAVAAVWLQGDAPAIPPPVGSPRPSEVAARGPDTAPRAQIAPAHAAPADLHCPAIDPAAASRAVAPPLGRPTFRRGADLIIDFSLDQIAPHPEIAGAGGIAVADPAFDGLRGCTESPTGELAVPGAAIDHAAAALRVEITSVEPAGTPAPGGAGARCSYRLTDAHHPELYASLGRDDVPAGNALTGLVRDGNAVYATLQFNGHARATHRKGNLVAMLDLCEHRVVWRSADLTSNAAIALRGDALITGYGFTAEPDSLTALNRWTGARLQRIPLPRTPSELRIRNGTLYVRLYDGYAIVPLR